MKLPRLRALLGTKRSPPSYDPLLVQRIIENVDNVLPVGWPLIRSRCLTRGLTLYYFLRRAGLGVGLCFGVEEFEERLAGHCWLIKDGKPFCEPKDPRQLYKIVYCFPEKPTPLERSE
jgi:hypothetical protein